MSSNLPRTILGPTESYHAIAEAIANSPSLRKFVKELDDLEDALKEELFGIDHDV